MPALDDAATVDDQDLVGVADRGQPVRDDQRGAPGQRAAASARCTRDLGLAVQVGGGLVEDDDAAAP